MSKEILFTSIDVSKHNGKIDWDKFFKSHACPIVGLRMGYGSHTYDERYDENAKALVKHNAKALLYWFSYAYTDAMADNEADKAIAGAKKYWADGKALIAFDFEGDSKRYAESKGVKVTKALATSLAITFLSKVERAGFIPVIYANLDYCKNKFDMDKIKASVPSLVLWYAQYNTKPNSTWHGKCDIWQYSSKGKADGITSSGLDMNYFYSDFGIVPASATPVEKETYPKYTGTSGSITLALKAVGEKDVTFSHRKKIAFANGFKSYSGTASQNLEMVRLLKLGKLIKA